jgi:hypothetical protein
MRAIRRSVGPVGILALAGALVTGALLLAGCGGGGGGGGGGAADLRGTVAEGALLASVPVVTMDAGGASTSTTTDGSGQFSFPGPFAFPVLVQAQTPFGNLYGWALGPGTANVTSLTTLALMVNTSLADNLDTVFAGWPGSGVAAVTLSAMHAAQAVVNANLSAQMSASAVDPTTYDFATATFPPVGSGIDAVLDGLDIVFDFGAGTFALAEAGGGPTVAFDAGIDTSAITIGGGGGGGGAGPGAFGTLTVGNSPPLLSDQFQPDFATEIGGASWSRSLTLNLPGFFGVAQQYLYVTFDPAAPNALTSPPQYVVAYGAITGTAPSPAQSYYRAACAICTASSLGITINTGARTVTFSGTTLPAAATGAVTTEVVLNGTLSY